MNARGVADARHEVGARHEVSAPIRILVLTNYYPPAHVGGYELACRDAVEGLKRRGHEVTVLTGTHGNPPPKPGVLRRLRFIDYKTPSYADKHRVEVENHRHTLEAIRGSRPDVVYVWNLRLVSLAPAFAVQEAGIPAVYDFGDAWPGSYLKPGLAAWAKRTAKSLLPGFIGGRLRIDRGIAVSRWLARTLETRFGAAPMTVLPNFTAPPVPYVPRPADGPLKLLFVGRLDDSKGVHVAIEALASATGTAATGTPLNATLTVVGGGEDAYRDHCTRLAADLGIADRVTFTGQRPNPTSFYADHHLLIVPTLGTEAFGLVVIEAMAQGLPVAASNAWGPAEIITPGCDGFLFTPGDAADLADVVRRAATDRAGLEAMGRAGQVTVSARYLEHHRMDGVERILGEAAADGARTRRGARRAS